MKHKSNTTCFSFFNVTLARCYAIYRSEIITVCTHPQMAPLGINSFLRMGIQLNLINELVPVKHQTSIQKLFPKSIGTHAEHCAAGSATNSLFHSSCPFGFVDRKAPVDNNLIDCLCHEFPVHFLPVFLWQPELYREKEQTPIGKRLLCEKLQTCHLINVICFISLNYFTPAPHCTVFIGASPLLFQPGYNRTRYFQSLSVPEAAAAAEQGEGNITGNESLIFN